MRVALVTRTDLPAWEVDDRPLHDALRARGATVAQPAWSDAAVDWAGFDIALLRTPWDYQERLPAFLDWLAATEAVVPVLHDGAVVAWNARKTYLRDLAARGVPVAPTVWLTAGEPVDVGAVLAAHGWTRAFLKPVVGSTAWETLRFDASADGVASAQAHLARVGVDMMLQPYLATVEDVGEWSVIVIDGAATHAVRKVPVAGDYRVQDDFGAHDEPLPLTPALDAFAARALAAAGAHLGRAAPFLYARVDVLHHDGGLVLNELEVIEPSLFFRHGPHAAGRLADALLARVSADGGGSPAGR
ncbi:MAG: hypothetical protein H6733_15485 [Alphaproteobacteria bacterium]|nr:hypothetical protein [Alphaproteobacteria bacterium]